ncbi:MAG TPA: flagellar hook-length control protein FliK [Burkholderiaceae bacterium]
MTPLPIADAAPPARAPSPAPRDAGATDRDARAGKSFEETFRSVRDPQQPSPSDRDGASVARKADHEGDAARAKDARRAERDDEKKEPHDRDPSQGDAAEAAALVAQVPQAPEPDPYTHPAETPGAGDRPDHAEGARHAPASGFEMLKALRAALAADGAGVDAVSVEGDDDTGKAQRGSSGAGGGAGGSGGTSASARFTAQLASAVQASASNPAPASLNAALVAAAQAGSKADAAPAADHGARTDATAGAALGSLPTSLPAATAPLVTRSVALPMTDPHWSQAMAQAVVDAVGTDGGRVRLQLNPAHLGPVDIALDIDKDQAKLQIFAAQAPTRAALQQAIPQLGALLASGGLQLAHADVFTGQSGQQGGGSDASSTPADAGSSSPIRVEAPTARALSLHQGLFDDYA